MKKSSLTLSRPKAILLELVMLWGKIKNAEINGYNKCITCGFRALRYFFSGGHFIPQSSGDSTRYELDNVNCQCSSCNGEDDQGRQTLHGFYIDQMYGQGRADELRKLSYQVKFRSLTELETTIDQLTSLIIKKFLSFTKPTQVTFLIYIKKQHRKIFTSDLHSKIIQACKNQ